MLTDLEPVANAAKAFAAAFDDAVWGYVAPDTIYADLEVLQDAIGAYRKTKLPTALEYLDLMKPYRGWVCTYRQGSVMKWEQGTWAYGMVATDNDPLIMWAFAKEKLDEASVCPQP